MKQNNVIFLTVQVHFSWVFFCLHSLLICLIRNKDLSFAEKKTHNLKLPSQTKSCFCCCCARRSSSSCSFALKMFASRNKEGICFISLFHPSHFSEIFVPNTISKKRFLWVTIADHYNFSWALLVANIISHRQMLSTRY